MRGRTKSRYDPQDKGDGGYVGLAYLAIWREKEFQLSCRASGVRVTQVRNFSIPHLPSRELESRVDVIFLLLRILAQFTVVAARVARAELSF